MNTAEQHGIQHRRREAELAALREENARLKARLVEMYERIIPEEIAKGLERLTRERDEAREKLASLETDYAEAQDIAVSESAGRRAAEAKLAKVVEAERRALAILKELALDRQTDYERLIGKVVDGLEAALAAAKGE